MVKLNQNLSARHAWPVDDQANRADRRQRLRIRRDADAVDGETILPAGYRLHEQFNLRARVPERNRCRRPSAAASETIRLEPDPRIDGSTSLMRPGIHKGSIVRCDHRRRHRVKQDRRSVALRPRRLRVTEAAQLGRRHTSSRARSQKTTPRKPVSHPGAPRLHAHPLPPSGLRNIDHISRLQLPRASTNRHTRAALLGGCRVGLDCPRACPRAALTADEQRPIDRLRCQINLVVQRCHAAVQAFPTFHPHTPRSRGAIQERPAKV